MARWKLDIKVPCAEVSEMGPSGQDGSKLFRGDWGQKEAGSTLASEVMSKSFTFTWTWSLHHGYCGSYLLIST